MDHDDTLVRAVGQVEGKLDSLIDLIKAHVEDDKKVEQRVRALEKWRAYMIGIGAAAGAAGSKAMALFGGAP